MSIIIFIVRYKSGDVTDINNNRLISLSSTMSKLFKLRLLELCGAFFHNARLSVWFEEVWLSGRCIYKII